VPYRVAALGSFTSYAVGHNVGASVFSGGAVRYRIYSAWGLSVLEVTKICFVAGLTFWLGNATVLGLGILDAPQQATEIDQLPLWLNRVLALVILAALLAAYIAWVWVKPRIIGREGWQVTLPGGPLTLVQIAPSASSICRAARSRCTCWCRTSRISALCRSPVIFVAATLLGFRQPCARRPRRVRRDHDGCAVAIRQGRLARRLIVVPFALLHHSVRHFAGDPGNAGSLARPRGVRQLARPVAAPMRSTAELAREKSDLT
jgi:hypothetical protein